MQAPARQTKPYGNPAKAKLLVIGHDPRLQDSHTIAEFCCFADYYFREKPTHPAEKSKYEFAEALFKYVDFLTDGMYNADQVLVTNLCNQELPHAPKGKTVLIPREIGIGGLEAIRLLLAESQIRWIFAMSQQVNYWLQELGFYPSVPQFLVDAEPKASGLSNQPPFYEPRRGRAFLQICGNAFTADERYTLFPVLHVKNWPLKSNFQAYEPCYMRYTDTFRELSRPTAT